MTRTTRAERLALPLGATAIRDLTEAAGGCIRPVQLRRTDTATGEVDYQFLPCRSTLEDVCPPCAKRARSLRAEQCRDGWHLDKEPDLTPAPPDETQEYWLTARAAAQARRDKAAANRQNTTELDHLLADLDHELAACGVRGNLATRTATPDGTGRQASGGPVPPAAARTHPTSRTGRCQRGPPARSTPPRMATPTGRRCSSPSPSTATAK